MEGEDIDGVNDTKCPESLKSRRQVYSSKSGSQNIQERNQINVVTYNILADCHVQRGHYHEYTDRKYLDLNARHKLIMKELKYLNGDIVCLQEVGPEYYAQTLEPEMKTLGYVGFYEKRTDSFYDEGCATFYLSNKFRLVSHDVHYLGAEAEKVLQLGQYEEELRQKVWERYVNRADILLVTKLQYIDREHTILVGNTHLVWGSTSLPDVRCLQMFIIMKILQTYTTEDCASYILCGDFNAEPNTPVYKIVTSKEDLNEDDLQTLKKDMDNIDTISVLSETLLKKPESLTFALKSSCLEVMNSEPELTNLDDEFQLCLDFIFFGNREINIQTTDAVTASLVPISVLNCPPLQEMKRFLPPSKVYPSDHIPLKTTFALYNKKR